jgi:hypothetical protein
MAHFEGVMPKRPRGAPATNEARDEPRLDLLACSPDARGPGVQMPLPRKSVSTSTRLAEKAFLSTGTHFSGDVSPHMNTSRAA